jgi:DNA-binding transcriptional regulator LsrR (DeoR family)
MRIAEIHWAMARLNISVPDDLYRAATKWRGTINLSDVCSRALRRELLAAESVQTPENFLRLFRPRTQIELDLRAKWSLRDAVIVSGCSEPAELREHLGSAAATYIDERLADGMTFGVCGGGQMWCLTRALTRRQLSLRMTAVGLRQVDPRVLHVHPNTLVTLMTLLYGSQSFGYVVGAKEFSDVWGRCIGEHSSPSILAFSCGPYGAASGIAKLLDPDANDVLLRKGVVGDAGYVFLTRNAEVVDLEVDQSAASLLRAADFQLLSNQANAVTLLVAGGNDKLPHMVAALNARLANTLITDESTALKLLH